MKKAKLHHNPGAGEEDYTGEELCALIRKEGFECREFSTENDFIIVAGGDGTVRKTVRELLQPGHQDAMLPLALLPMGTANNIAETLSIKGTVRDLVRNWHQHQIKPFDIGMVTGTETPGFFLEAAGVGIFPELIRHMEPLTEELNKCDSAGKIKIALQQMHDLLPQQEAFDCELEIDGRWHHGHYLLVEIMNTRAIGPNLLLAPHADPGDGMLEVVLVPEKQRFDLAAYIDDQLNDIASLFPFPAIRARQIKLKCNTQLLHLDDQLFEVTNPPILSEISVQPGRLAFLI